MADSSSSSTTVWAASSDESFQQSIRKIVQKDSFLDAIFKA